MHHADSKNLGGYFFLRQLLNCAFQRKLTKSQNEVSAARKQTDERLLHFTR